jgi:putative transposase
VSHAYTRLLYHLVFATKLRSPRIGGDLKAPLYEYFGGIVRELGGTVYEVNGMPDHVHLLVCLRPRVGISAAVHQIKGSSSRWLNQRMAEPRNGGFWQEGYSAFSVSESQMPIVRRYIQNQEEHHHSYSFDEELTVLLKKHRIDLGESAEPVGQNGPAKRAPFTGAGD